ncbi:MAG TPA: carbonic anhydrase [Terriglobales bacterium]|nr:carbonic anhydrase [Terriglobales bacterium]
MTRTLLYLSLLLSIAGFGFAQHAPATPAKHSAHAAASQPTPSADAVWAELMAGNRRFVADKPRAHALIALRRKLASGQSPHVIVLACSDSRVPPEVIFDQSLGDLFVVRTAGNVADAVALGSIEYAVDHFHSPLLVVLGHQKCGAVTAACSGEKMPSRNLDAIVEKINPAVTQAKTYAKADDLVESAIRENVRQSAKDVLANSEILREAVKSGKLKVIEAEYLLGTGSVVRLDIPAGSQN